MKINIATAEKTPNCTNSKLTSIKIVPKAKFAIEIYAKITSKVLYPRANANKNTATIIIPNPIDIPLAIAGGIMMEVDSNKYE